MGQVKIGIIGGTGLGEALGAESGQWHQIETPFGRPSAPILQTQLQGQSVVVLQRHGAGHMLSPSQVPYRANIFALKSLGVTHILASGATGSLRQHYAPGDLVIVDQLIDKTHCRVSTFYKCAAVHVEFADPFCPVMRQWLLDAATRMEDFRVHDGGTYVCMEGPAFSTRAESQLHRSWGGDLIGMTAMPEAKLAREAEMAYALIAMPTDYDCWKSHNPGTDRQALLEEIMTNLERATRGNIGLMKAAIEDLSMLEHHRSPAHTALDLAIWSAKSSIDRAEVERLAILWGRHFAQ